MIYMGNIIYWDVVCVHTSTRMHSCVCMVQNSCTGNGIPFDLLIQLLWISLNVQNLLRTEFVITTSNAALERILYKQTWADCRNPLNINPIKVKHQIQSKLIMIFSFYCYHFAYLLAVNKMFCSEKIKGLSYGTHNSEKLLEATVHVMGSMN